MLRKPISEPVEITYRTITYSAQNNVRQSKKSALADHVLDDETAAVLQGVIIKRVEPAYPQSAKSAGVSGKVNVHILIDEEGDVISARVLSSVPLLNETAESAAIRLKIAPTLKAGEPTQSQGIAEFNFILPPRPRIS
ncbi:MAG TPA: energy transducer TonB [Pyrinomonadaceae bacterium]